MLPVEDVLLELVEALRRTNKALLVAPPGAGKTTRVAPALLDEPWCDGEILLLVPRRIAARAAADYMARERGEAAGRTIGHATRLDSKPGKRLTAMTHGVFLARIQADPELAGVSALLFDEAHERSLDNDLGLALALETQAALREDLRILLMSATLDVSAYGDHFGDAPLIQSEGKSYPLTLDHVGRDATLGLEQAMVRTIRAALAHHDGSLLAFLPGVREIERTADALGTLPETVILHRLHGQVDPAAQRAALAPVPKGKRKLVLSSAIAETSVTVNDVRIVVDSGLARRPRFDVGAGLTRLVTERASRASVTQRAGRAARQAPGIAIRLWEEAANKALPPHDPPEIAEADLAPLLLASLCWGQADPTRLALPTPPPTAALDAASALLHDLGAIGEDGLLTNHGRAIASLPLEPRLAHMLIIATDRGFGSTAALAAILLTERGLGGRGEDLEARGRRALSDRGHRANKALGLARHWARSVEADEPMRPERLAQAVAIAFPDRVARRRARDGRAWQSVGGRGFSLDPASPLATAPWLAIAEVAGAAAGARILSAAALDTETVEALFGKEIERFETLDYDPGSGRVTARTGRRLGAVTLSSGQADDPDPDALLATLLDGVARHGLAPLPFAKATRLLRQRAGYARAADPAIPDLSDRALVASRDDWLAPLLPGLRQLSQIDANQLHHSLEAMIGYDALKRIDRLAPATFTSPAGSSHDVDYDAPAGPTVSLRAQALYGLTTHPMIGNDPLVIELLSPAGRPLQTTTDLPAFWVGSWADVAKDMRGRYPKHDWPVDPASAKPDLRTKRARKRSS